MSNVKNCVIGAVVGSFILTQGVFAADIAVAPSQNALSVKSETTINKVDAVPAYMYNDSNYFMLRDIGKIVGYQVDWDKNTNKTILKKDKSVQKLDGLSAVKQTENVNKGQQTIIIDENEYKDIECLNIDGYNYFKLRDLAEKMDFKCDWNNDTNSVILTLDEKNTSENSNLPDTNISVDKFIDPDLNQKIIEEDVVYVYGSNDYKEIEKYMRENIDKNFSIDDYIITEDNMNGSMPGYNSLIMRLNVNGVSSNFGYSITCLNNKVSLVTFIGEKNADFNTENVNKQQLSDEEAKKKAIEADGYDYKIDEQRINRFFDMKDLKYKCEVETVYIDNNGEYFATSHIF